MASRTGKGRPTIAEIAARSGVSSGAVSYALNGRPGVSDETRARILQVAEEVGWVPSAAARALRGGGAAAIGLVITREPAMLGVEPFFMSFVAGIEQAISDQGYALLLQVTPDRSRELDTYRRWWNGRRVDGIILTDLMVDDPRLEVIRELGVPAVAVGDGAYSRGLPAVSSDDARAAAVAVDRLADLGHVRIARIAGPSQLAHTHIRTEAIRAAARRRGVELVGEATTDYSLQQGSDACARFLTMDEPPTAILCDNDLTALGAVRAANAAGVPVPDRLSILAWDDSPLCEFTEPQLTAIRRAIPAYGAAAARALISVVRTGEIGGEAPPSVATLVERGSLAPAPTR